MCSTYIWMWVYVFTINSCCVILHSPKASQTHAITSEEKVQGKTSSKVLWSEPAFWSSQSRPVHGCANEIHTQRRGACNTFVSTYVCTVRMHLLTHRHTLSCSCTYVHTYTFILFIVTVVLLTFSFPFWLSAVIHHRWPILKSSHCLLARIPKWTTAWRSRVMAVSHTLCSVRLCWSLGPSCHTPRATSKRWWCTTPRLIPWRYTPSSTINSTLRKRRWGLEVNAVQLT